MKLLFFNGTTGVGKSTLTRSLLERLPGAFLVDVDSLRKQISGYRESSKESRERALEVSIAVIECNLRSGHDVIVDRTSVNPRNIDRILEVGTRYNAENYEFILHASKETILGRAEGRGYKVGGLLTPQSVAGIWDEIQGLVPRRKNAIIVDTECLTQKEVLEKVWQHLS